MISIKEGLTFDDVLLVPAYSEILPSHTSIQTHLTNKIKLNIPLLSAAMDTVSESDLVIALAQEEVWVLSIKTYPLTNNVDKS